MTPTDAELIDRVLAGERDRFADLVERHGAVLHAALRRLLPNPEDVRDAFQDACVRGFERLGTVREGSQLRSWWLSIAMNAGRDRLRRAGTAGAIGSTDAEAAPEPEAPAAPPGAELEAAEERDRLRAAVAALPPRQRAVLELRLQGDLSHAEVAAALDITEANSRANHYQALKTLRRRLGGEEDER